MKNGDNRKKGFISGSKLHSVIIDDNATDKTLVDCYQSIKDLIRKEKFLNDSTLRKGIDRRTS
ncbi:hypothetical protein FZC76_07845 [Sutcliffiella horikoshii]|uniref:Uncharacterized protein n=1 Tax=Sutcliffiella horikoshii TaxID=79883 RepID=A0A5D4T308_9BACI|nr:hypothetical protein [Sutcliffiella horikoshii]TYS68842.1 hypothetical protein FZC76_07845 [Sutcliffiella horikoshii]